MFLYYCKTVDGNDFIIKSKTNDPMAPYPELKQMIKRGSIKNWPITISKICHNENDSYFNVVTRSNGD